MSYPKISMPGPMAGMANGKIEYYGVGVLQQSALKYAENIVSMMQYAIAKGD